MRVALAFALLLVLPATMHAGDEPQRENKVNEPPGLLEVGTIATISVNGSFVGFNDGRQYAISINEYVPQSRASRTKLAATLKEQGYLDQSVFEWFGKASPKRIDIQIGDKVPVAIVQAVIAAYNTDPKTPVFVAFAPKDDNQVQAAYHVYVGGLLKCNDIPLTTDQTKELLKPGLTSEELARLLPRMKN